MHAFRNIGIFWRRKAGIRDADTFCIFEMAIVFSAAYLDIWSGMNFSTTNFSITERE